MMNAEEREKLSKRVKVYLAPHINGKVSDKWIDDAISDNPELLENKYPLIPDDEILNIDANMDLFMEWLVEEEEDELAAEFEELYNYWKKYGPHDPSEIFSKDYNIEDHDPEYFPDFMEWLDDLHDERREVWLIKHIKADTGTYPNYDSWFDKLTSEFIDYYENPHHTYRKYETQFTRYYEEPQEVLAWFTVPEWLYDRLRSHNEVVAEIEGVYCWGRTDGSNFNSIGVLVDIVQEMGLGKYDDED